MNKKIIPLFAIFLFSLSISNISALDCPKQPEQLNKEWDAEVDLAVAKIWVAKGADLKVKTRKATKDLLGKLPNADKVYLEQMMYAAYCSALRDDKTLKESEKAKMLELYNKELRRSLTSTGKNEKADDKRKQKSNSKISEVRPNIPYQTPKTKDSFAKSNPNSAPKILKESEPSNPPSPSLILSPYGPLSDPLKGYDFSKLGALNNQIPILRPDSLKEYDFLKSILNTPSLIPSPDGLLSNLYKGYNIDDSAKKKTEDELPQKESFSEEIRPSVKSSKAALGPEIGSSRVKSLKALLPSLPNDLNANEIELLLGSETTSFRGECLELLVVKVKKNSLDPDKVHSILGLVSGTVRLNCIETISPCIKGPINGKQAGNILGFETGSSRVGCLRLIASLIKRPLSESDMTEILSGLSGSNRAEAIGLLN